MLVSILIMLAETSSVTARLAILDVNYKLSHCFYLYIIYKIYFLFFVFTLLIIVNYFSFVNP